MFAWVFVCLSVCFGVWSWPCYMECLGTCLCLHILSTCLWCLFECFCVSLCFLVCEVDHAIWNAFDCVCVYMLIVFVWVFVCLSVCFCAWNWQWCMECFDMCLSLHDHGVCQCVLVCEFDQAVWNALLCFCVYIFCLYVCSVCSSVCVFVCVFWCVNLTMLYGML